MAGNIEMEIQLAGLAIYYNLPIELRWLIDEYMWDPYRDEW